MLAARFQTLEGRALGAAGERRIAIATLEGPRCGRELEVAELVSHGMRNREIAAELFLSERTIETQLSRVFAKLGVSSRAEVAGEVGRETG